MEGISEDLGKVLLNHLAAKGSFNSYELSRELGKDHQQVVGAINSIQSLGDVSCVPVTVGTSCSYLSPSHWG